MLAVQTHLLRKVYATTKRAPGSWGAVKSLFAPERIDVEAVKGINLTLEVGEMVGFLGPNGAGKTTTLKMLSGILFPTSGEVSVLGFTPWRREPAMLRRISLVMGNKMQLWWDLPAWDSFLVLKEVYEVDPASFKKRTDFLIDALDIGGKINTQVRKLSLGERMKCELVAALLHSPEVVFLDEPTLGLDVVSQKRIRDFIKQLHRVDNCTVLLTSHYMQDVEELCDRVVVIDHGSAVYEGTLQGLATEYQETRRIQLVFSVPVQRGDLERYGNVVEFDERSGTLEVPRAETASRTAAVLTDMPVEDVQIQEVEIEQVLRDLFARGDVSRETSS
jgi:ABC-2 type transport system ATP-binding protein